MLLLKLTNYFDFLQSMEDMGNILFELTKQLLFSISIAGCPSDVSIFSTKKLQRNKCFILDGSNYFRIANETAEHTRFL